MTTEKQSGTRIGWQRISLVERYSSALYPLDPLDLLRLIPTINFVVPELVLRGTLEQGKPIATKGSVELVMNTDNKTLGVVGRDPDEVVTSFNALVQMYRERLDPSPGMNVHYVEVDAQGWAKSNRSPVEIATKFWSKSAPLKQLGSVIDIEVSNFGLQLCPPDQDPNSPSWFHIFIEPSISSSDTRYRVRWIFRNPDAAQVLQLCSDLNDKVKKLIGKLESS